MKYKIKSPLIFSAIFVLILSLSSIIFIAYNTSTAKNLTITLRNEILRNNLVQVGFIFEQFTGSNFLEIKIQDKDYRPSRKITSYNLEVPVYLDENEIVYSRKVIFKLNFIFVYLFSFILTLFIYFAINKLLKSKLANLEKELEIKSKIEKERELTKLTSEFIHDIKSPLNALEISISNLKTKSGSQIEIDQANHSIRRIKDIGNYFLEAENINESWADLLLIEEELRFILEEKNIEHSIKIDFVSNITKNSKVIADRKKFHRVISNIINNCVEACGTTPQISIDLTEKEDSISINITDNGPGFPENILNNLNFLPLSTKSTGKGIGLSSAHHNVNLWGGSLKISNLTSKGARIEIKLKDYSDYQILHLEDDELLRIIWEKEGSKITNIFHTFQEADDDFYKYLIEKNSIIYLDSNLGDISGESLIPQIMNYGNKDKVIFIQSGKRKEVFKNISDIYGVTDKKPNWIRR